MWWTIFVEAFIVWLPAHTWHRRHSEWTNSIDRSIARLLVTVCCRPPTIYSHFPHDHWGEVSAMLHCYYGRMASDVHEYTVCSVLSCLSPSTDEDAVLLWWQIDHEGPYLRHSTQLQTEHGLSVYVVCSVCLCLPEVSRSLSTNNIVDTADKTLPVVVCHWEAHLSRSFKVIGDHVIPWRTYEFLLTFSSNYASILHFLRI